jgi:hypothetical protein
VSSPAGRVLADVVDGANGADDWDLRKAIASGSFAGNETVSLILSAVIRISICHLLPM